MIMKTIINKLIAKFGHMGPFKCYVTQIGQGVSSFPENKVTKV